MKYLCARFWGLRSLRGSPDRRGLARKFSRDISEGRHEFQSRGLPGMSGLNRLYYPSACENNVYRCDGLSCKLLDLLIAAGADRHYSHCFENTIPDYSRVTGDSLLFTYSEGNLRTADAVH